MARNTNSTKYVWVKTDRPCINVLTAPQAMLRMAKLELAGWVEELRSIDYNEQAKCYVTCIEFVREEAVYA